MAEPASLPAHWRTAHAPQPKSDRSLPGNSKFPENVRELFSCLLPTKMYPLCVCRTCYPYLEIQPREQPTTILRTLLTWGCFHPSLSNVHISPFLSKLKYILHSFHVVYFCYVTGSPCAAQWMSALTHAKLRLSARTTACSSEELPLDGRNITLCAQSVPDDVSQVIRALLVNERNNA